MPSIASKEQIRLDDEEMMMTSVDEAKMMMMMMMMMSVDEAKMMTDDIDEKTMMTNEEDDAETKMRYELDMVAQPCKRTRHGAKSTIARSMVAKQYTCKTLGGEIGGLQADVINSDADKSESNAQRKRDHAAFTAEEQVHSESVDTLERATQVLSKKDRDIPGAAASLLQIQNKLPLQPSRSFPLSLA